MMQFLLLLMAAILSIPLIVVGSQCLLAIVTRKQKSDAPVSIEPNITYKILIPAHNEAGIIGKTLAKLIPELPDSTPQNVVLVADNCNDATAAIAASYGIKVLIRQDIAQRGKGFALDFGIQNLKNNQPPQVLVIMDADCETTKASLTTLINLVASKNRPAQMTYLMRLVENASIKQKIAGFAWLLKNKIRLAAMTQLGFPIVLTGTGMAFPWAVFDTVKLGHSNIVEDMQLGIDCAVNGHPVLFCSQAIVYSDFPEQSTAELSQRTRWEHGHIQTIVQQLPFLIKEVWRQKNWQLFALAMDIGVPPLSLQILISLSGLALLATFAWVLSNATAFLILLLSFTYFATMLIGVWWYFGQTYLSARELFGIPLYVLSKLSIYVGYIFKRQKEWVRTDRDT